MAFLGETIIMRIAILFLMFGSVHAQTISECRELLRTGEYQNCLVATKAAIEKRSYGEDWPLLQATAQMNLGQYQEAKTTLNAGLERYAWSIRLRALSMQLCRYVGEHERIAQLLQEIESLGTNAPWRYSDADDLVASGQAALAMGIDPRLVLEGFFDRARTNYKSRPDGFLASGRLAADKGDKVLAAEILQPALERFPDNPDLKFEYAKIAPTNEIAAALVDATLQINPHHAAALRWLAVRQIDQEEYDEAVKLLEKILQVNPHDPDAHGLIAVIHHLQGQLGQEQASVAAAMQSSGPSPEVLYLVGRQLSKKYRFRESASYQQRALKIRPDFLPAQIQLAQDYLRLGNDTEGWRLAQAAQQQDKYSLLLFNLVSLKDHLDQFTQLTDDQFILRMESKEAAVYGKQVQALLQDAFQVLTKKYGFRPTGKIVVEIFDRPDDFAVRTFGIPDVAGFLGVCFGGVITANSPVSNRDIPSNWHSVLWHEFCHVITLQMTDNRIPRWLSEGISVYEERLKDQRWGQRMTPSNRSRILSGKVTPVSRLSSAFLTAQTGEDLNFAYYESSMVIEFLVQEFGFDAVRKILQELKTGLTINDALARHTTAIEELDAAFANWLQIQATEFAPGVVFEKNATTLSSPLANNYAAGLLSANQLVKSKKYKEAETLLQSLIKLFPADTSTKSARRLLADVYKATDRPQKQAAVLRDHLTIAVADLQAATQLLELQITATDWEAAQLTAEYILQIDPMQPQFMRSILQIAEASQHEKLQQQMLMGLLELEPGLSADWHYRLAKLKQESSPQEARRHVLRALETAPRFRKAHSLLLELTTTQSANKP